MRITLFLFLILMTLIMVNGCTVGPKFEKPTVETPEAYRSPAFMTDSLINLSWWNLFQDTTLATLVHTALKNNRDIQIAASRVEEARAFHGFTKADQLPKLDITAGATRGNFIQSLQLETINNNFFIAPVLGWELDFWGKYRQASEAARSELLASEFNLRKLQIGLISDVVSTYFALLDYRQRLKIARYTLQLREESLHIINQRFDKGIIPEIDVYQAQMQREIAAGAVPAFERQVVQTENTLSILLGKLPQTFNIDKGPDLILHPPDIPAGLPAQLLERRPDIAEAEFRLRAQTARIGVAEAQRLPSISLTGTLGKATDDLSQLTTGEIGWSVGGSLFGPIFNFNKNIRRVDIEEERARQALLFYENTVLQAFREVEDALTEVQTYRDQLLSKQRELEASQGAAELSRSRYDKGFTSYLEVLESERSLFSVELQYSEVQAAYNNAYVRLYKTLGGGWITRQEAADSRYPGGGSGH